MSDTVEQIKSRLDIADVISGYLKVQKAGASYKARCPFHNEKTPSFHISPERQSWHCFGCGKGGDMFAFIQEIEGVPFPEALRTLAAKAGVEIPQWRPGQAAQADIRGPLFAVAELSAKFFEKQLWNGTAGARALEYLRERGLTDETIRAWRLGWAPNDWRALTPFLTAESHRPGDIVGAGMAIQKEARNPNDEIRMYDRFRSRIMFPISDANGRVVGFTGRVFGAQVAVAGEEPAKYVNTPATAIYDKSRVLFGLDKAKLDMRRRDSCLLVEGNMDAIMAWQAGATNAVATSGTALTLPQLQQLARYSMNLSFCFDTDGAGQIATRRGIGLALSQQFSVNVLTIADGECKDPADYVKKYGEAFNAVVSSAKPVMQYYYDMATAGYEPHSAESKKKIVASLASFIKRLGSKVEQSHWIGRLAVLLRTEEANVQADIAAAKDDLAIYDKSVELPATSYQLPAISIEPLDPHNQELLGLLLKCPELVPDAQELDASLLDQRVVNLIRNPELLQAGIEHEHKELVDVAAMRATEMWSGWEPVDLRAELMHIVNRLRIRRLVQVNARLAMDIQDAETQDDKTHRNVLIAQFQQNTQELNQLRELLIG